MVDDSPNSTKDGQ